MSEPIRLPTDTERHDRLWQAVLAAEEWHVREPNSFGAALTLSVALSRYANFMLAAERALTTETTEPGDAA